MARTINLLADTPSGHSRVEGVFDLKAEAFALEHVRELRRGLAEHCGLAPESVGIVSIARWMPAAVVAMPSVAAEGVVRSFERSDPALLAALRGLPVRLLTLDADSTIEAKGPAEEKQRRRFQDRELPLLEAALLFLLLAVLVLWMVSLISHTTLP